MEKTTPSIRVWFYQDTTFHIPRAHLNAKLWSSIPYSNPHKSVLATLYVTFINDALESLGDTANHKSFSYSLNKTPTGLELQIRGYNDGLGLYTTEIFKELNRVPDVSQQRFENVKQNLLNLYRNKQYQKPNEYVCQLVAAVLRSEKFTTHELMEALASTSLEDVLHFRKLLFSDVQLELLFHGNLLPTKALAIADSITNAFHYETASPSTFSDSGINHLGAGHPRMVQLPKGKHIVLRTQHPNFDEKNSISYLYYQYDQGSVLDEVYALLLALVASDPEQMKLHTVEKPGDVTSSFDESMFGVPGFAMFVMSPNFNSVHLNQRVNDLVLVLQQHLYDITTEKDNDFHRFVDALRNDLQKDFVDIGERTNNFWSEIMSGQLRFDRRKVYDSLLNNSDQVIRDGFRLFTDHMFGQKSSYLTVDIDSGKKKKQLFNVIFS